MQEFSSFLFRSRMPQSKYESPNPRRTHTLMSAEEVASGKKSSWSELELAGTTCSLSVVFCLSLDKRRYVRYKPTISTCMNSFAAGSIRNLSPQLWDMTTLTALYLNDNSLGRLPPDVSKLQNLVSAINYFKPSFETQLIARAPSVVYSSLFWGPPPPPKEMTSDLCEVPEAMNTQR